LFGENVVPDAITIKFMPFDEFIYINNNCCMVNDDIDGNEI
jgi:hypothetical protein